MKWAYMEFKEFQCTARLMDRHTHEGRRQIGRHTCRQTHMQAGRETYK